MTDPIVLTLPEDISDHVRRIAASTSQSVEQILIEYLRTLSSPIPELPPDDQAELDALRHLSDDALWTIAREQLPEDVQARAHDLMEKNTRGTISLSESTELEKLVQRADRVMLRKAEASAILRERGHSFTQKDFLA